MAKKKDNISLKGYRYRLKPNKEQREYLNQAFGCVRKLYNYYVESLYTQLEEQDYESGYIDRKKITISEVSQVKKRFPYMKDIDSLAYANAKINFTRAIDNFNSKEGKKTFTKRARRWMKTKGYTPTFRDLKGMPSFKSKKNNDYSFTTNNQKGTIKLYSDVATGYTYIVIPKLKTPIRILLHRGLIEGATLKSVTISKDILGNFNISLLQEYETTPRKQTITEDNSIGLDYAQQDFYVDSEGQTANYPRYAKQMEVKLAKEQKKLSRMVLRSNNWFKQKKKVSQIQSKIARQRLDWSHKESTKIADSYAMVSLEDLDLRNLAQCLSLGKNLHDNGFGKFRTALEYKLQERGGLLIKIDKWFPSSKVCSECGVIHENLQLSDRTYVCDSCGLTISRDHNAAINIKREGLRIAFS